MINTTENDLNEATNLKLFALLQGAINKKTGAARLRQFKRSIALGICAGLAPNVLYSAAIEAGILVPKPAFYKWVVREFGPVKDRVACATAFILAKDGVPTNLLTA